MQAVDDVVLDPATADDAPLIENLLQLYLHDLSETFPIDVGLDGRFAYDMLPRYWIDPARRFAFLVRYRGAAGGVHPGHERIARFR